MIYYQFIELKNDSYIQKYFVTFNRKRLEEVKEKIILDCSKKNYNQYEIITFIKLIEETLKGDNIALNNLLDVIYIPKKIDATGQNILNNYYQVIRECFEFSPRDMLLIKDFNRMINFFEYNENTNIISDRIIKLKSKIKKNDK